MIKTLFLRFPLAAILSGVWASSAFAAVNYVPSGSMLPSVQIGSLMLVDKRAYGLRVPFTTVFLTKGSAPQRGEIATFTPPGSRLQTYVKRIVAVPGDQVELRDGVLRVNGQEISSTQGLPLDNRQWQLGPDQVFVAGDNSANSWDSRFWGPLPLERLTGRVAGVLNTFNRHQSADH